MHTLHMPTANPYDIHIGSGLIEKAGSLLAGIFKPCRVAVVTDSNVHPLYSERVISSLSAHGFQCCVHVFPAGEQNKNIFTLSDILEFLAESQLCQTDFVLALGGGVTGDMAGFAAAVFKRGMPFVQMPTTLLAAVDSSVGGKTAVDLKAGKNLAGAFHQPSLVLIDTDIIHDLPARLLSQGAAEVIKYGVLKDAEMFSWFCGGTWNEKLPQIIHRSVEIKRFYVQQDERDTGVRKYLNFGHTFGHAIEACSGFSVSHGFGVAMGMAIAAGAAGKRDICRAIIQANAACGLPSLPDAPCDALANAALADKKRSGQTIDLILPEEIGRCQIVSTPVSALPGLFAKGIETVKEIVL